MKINKKELTAHKTINIDDVKITLRPYPASMMIPAEDPELQAKQLLKMYQYCVVNWEGLIDENEKPIPCDDENKQFVYDYVTDLRDKILDHITDMLVKEDDEKN